MIKMNIDVFDIIILLKCFVIIYCWFDVMRKKNFFYVFWYMGLFFFN